MKLNITRGQAGKLFGGVKFQLEAKVELTDREMDLVKKYKMNDEILLRTEASIFGKTIGLAHTIGSLTSGSSFKCENVAEIISMEESLKSACGAFKKYLEVAESFGGTVSYDY